jgi:hypothetical protein
MASIEFGLVVTNARGKLGGHVFTKSRSGSTLRTKGIPTNPQTTAQQAVRATLGSLSSAWRTLTEAQRDSWNAAVDSFMKTNVFGTAYAPSGKNLYVSLNTNLTNAGQSTISVAPLPIEMIAPAISALQWDVSDVGGEFNFANNAADQTMITFATPNLSPGKYFVKSQYRILQTDTQSVSSAVNCYAAWTARFGADSIGSKIYVKVVAINNNTGQATSSETLSVIVTG